MCWGKEKHKMSIRFIKIVYKYHYKGNVLGEGET